MKMEVEREALQALTRLAKKVQDVFGRVKEGDAITNNVWEWFKTFDDMSKKAMEAMDETNAFDAADFTPVNGLASIVKVGMHRNVWEVVAIAKNWPQEHHPLQVGDLVIVDRTFYTYGRDTGPGSLHWISPKEINAIKRKP